MGVARNYEDIEKIKNYLENGVSLTDLTREVRRKKTICNLPDLSAQEDPTTAIPQLIPIGKGFFRDLAERRRTRKGQDVLRQALSWGNLYDSTIEQLGRRIAFILSADNATKQEAFMLSSLYQANANLLCQRMLGNPQLEAAEQLLRLSTTIEENLKDKLSEFSNDFDIEYAPVQRHTGAHAPQMLAYVVSIADTARRRGDKTLSSIRKSVQTYIKEFDITTVYGVATGGGVLAALTDLFARDDAGSALTPLFGVLAPAERSAITWAQDFDGKDRIIQEGGDPLSFRDYREGKEEVTKGNILVVDNILSSDSSTASTAIQHFRTHEKRAEIFFAANKTTSRISKNLSLTQLFGGNETKARNDELMSFMGNL